VTRQRLANSKRCLANPIALVALVVSSLGLAACPGSLSFVSDGGMAGQTGSDPDSGATMGCATANTVLQTNCNICHTNPPAGVYPNLDLTGATVAQRLVGQVGSTGNGAMCSGMPNLLNRSTLPATGILIDKINFKPGTCGSGMPLGGDVNSLSAADHACLQAWANGLVASVGP
jgi:hypothetical protein